ncbi:hypothetical protein [Streptomyces hesseae]|uniref:Transmembrane protein n=1 Tax=Streptomyces hesseae TaxID=3075519 RepID=A0ABU2SY56_9ACTN|nr:hypothetical protein [Streptomyces sp. DSM 40473]MDT0453938.1 hypothetical protein [Streptomyces sp. DSM 40473]
MRNAPRTTIPLYTLPDVDSKAWVTSALAAVVMLPLLAFDLMFIGLSPMATDSCGPDHCSAALNHALLAAPIVWLVALALLITTWALPSRKRFREPRVITALLSAAAGLACLSILANLPTG